MYRLIVVLAASTALAGCVTRPADVPPPPIEEPAPPAVEAPPAPKPEYGSYGFDAAGMNTNVKAGESPHFDVLVLLGRNVQDSLLPWRA